MDIGDIESLAEKMSLLADNPAKAKDIGSNATQLYQILKKERICEEWLRVLEN